MPKLCLPARPDLEHLKGQARGLQARVRAGDPAALALVRELHPRPGVVDAPEVFRRTDSQLVVARQYGFASWPELRRCVALAVEFGRSPHKLADLDAVPADEAATASADGDLPDRLLRLGCLLYGNDDVVRHRQARELLAARPELAGANIWTAAAVGDVAAARYLLDADPASSTRAGGPFGWAPLLYLAYSRVNSDHPGHDPLATAQLLLDRGADPNAGYLWEGNYPFTALTGLFGGGEDKSHQPAHSRAVEVARVLLEAGADPNDSQTLYNRQFEPDDSHLRLLIEFGLGIDKAGPWHTRLRSTHGTPAQLLEDQLTAAARYDRPGWATLALAAGADPDGRGTTHPVHHGLTPLAMALRRGNREVADLLLAAGATPPPADPVEEFLSACLAGAATEVERLRAAQPTVLDEARTRRPGAVLLAAELGRPAAVRLLVDLGFDVNARARITPLHQAAYDGNVELVQTLLELGADPHATDRSFGSTPLGWAQHARREAVIEILLFL